jgi:hypothetical protein
VREKGLDRHILIPCTHIDASKPEIVQRTTSWKFEPSATVLCDLDAKAMVVRGGMWPELLKSRKEFRNKFRDKAKDAEIIIDPTRGSRQRALRSASQFGIKARYTKVFLFFRWST